MRTERFEINGCPINVHYVWEHPIECGMCGDIVYDPVTYDVPWYCGPVMEGCSDGGYRTVCKKCFNKWEAWNSTRTHKEER